MQEKKYLKWHHKIGYGAGDIAGNCVYALLYVSQMVRTIKYFAELL